MSSKTREGVIAVVGAAAFAVVVLLLVNFQMPSGISTANQSEGAAGMRLSMQLLTIYKGMHQDMEEAKALLADLKGQVASIKAESDGTGALEQPVRQLVQPAAGIDVTKTLQEDMEATKSMLAELKAQVLALRSSSVRAAVGAAATVQQQQQGAQGILDNKTASAAALSTQSQDADVAQAGSAAGQPLCADNCFKAKDGVCDEGRGGNLTGTPGGENWVFCDLGTDCQDCGPWAGVPHGPTWQEAVGPIGWLQQQKVEVRIARTPYDPRIYFAYTDPKIDHDESGHMHKHKMIEPLITEVFYKVLKDKCDPSQPGKKGLVVDVGGNFGWFSTFAGALGCRVISFEPVLLFRAFYEYSTSRNGVRGQISLYPNIVSPDTTKEYNMVGQRGKVGALGQWGATRVGDLPGEDQGEGEKVKAVRVDDIVGQLHVDLMKVDVEGFEPMVIATSEKILGNGQVDNLIFEYAHGYFAKKPKQLVTMPDMLLKLFDLGYSMGHIHWGLVFAPPNPALGWATPLPQLEEIVRRHVEYDKWSAELIKNNTHPFQNGPTSHPCPELAQAGINTTQIPFAFWYTHPKGFHNHFLFNTNIWAARNRERVPFGPLVGHNKWPFDKPTTRQWFSEVNAQFGVGWAHCPRLGPESMVALRCRCKEPEKCAKHEEAAEICAKKGLLGYLE